MDIRFLLYKSTKIYPVSAISKYIPTSAILINQTISIICNINQSIFRFQALYPIHIPQQTIMLYFIFHYSLHGLWPLDSSVDIWCDRCDRRLCKFVLLPEIVQFILYFKTQLMHESMLFSYII